MVSNEVGSTSSYRDIFLSHQSKDKAFVRKLASDIEACKSRGRHLLTWLDEAEIVAGQSISAMVNAGLESSRFVGIVMTPNYFSSESGWTDAEWHAALFQDPDNRNNRLIPLLVADCPYIPYLLRHLKAIDFRGKNYAKGFQELLRVLRDEPIPRPLTYRGQLITSTGNIGRETVVVERASTQAYPDVVTEHLYCNLLPVEKLPLYIYSAPIAKEHRRSKKDGGEALPTKNELKQIITLSQQKAKVEYPFMPMFRLINDRVVTFHDLETPDGPLACITDDKDVAKIATLTLLQDEDDRKIIMSLLNMAIDRHANRIGLVIDSTKNGRYFFPPKDGGPHTIQWIPVRSKASRTVAKPYYKDEQLQFWLHRGAYIRMLFLASNLYLKIRPTLVITKDGVEVEGGPRVGPLIIKWTGPERNLQVLYHIRFWTVILRHGRGPTISVRTGDQTMEIATVPAFVEQLYGIGNDNRRLMDLLDREAQIIAEDEDKITEYVVTNELPDLITDNVEDDLEADDDDTEISEE